MSLRKSLTLTVLFAATIFSIDARGQETSLAPKPNEHHLSYRLVDLGTFGGPNSSETVEFPYINNNGLIVGFADTSFPDSSNPEGFSFHAFRWQGGLFEISECFPEASTASLHGVMTSMQSLGYQRTGALTQS